MPSPSPLARDDVLVPSSFGVAPPTATAVIGGRHRSLVIVPFSRTVAVIVLILLLPPERTHPRRATYDDDDGGPASISAGGLSSSSARRHERPASIHPLPPSAPRQHRRRNSRHVRRPLEVACVRTSVFPSFYAPFEFFPVGIAMNVQPRRWRSESPHPRPIPIPMRGDAATPEGPNSVSSLSRGALNSSPTPSGISAVPPVVVVVATAVVIIVVVDKTSASTSSSRVGRPITRGTVNVDVAAGAAAAELFDFRSVPPPPWVAAGVSAGVVASSPPPPSWWQESTMMTTKTVASFRGDDDDDDGRII